MAHPPPGDADKLRRPTRTPVFGAPATALVDDAGRITGWSSGMTELLGHAAEAVIGRPLGSVLAGSGEAVAGEAGTHGPAGSEPAAGQPPTDVPTTSPISSPIASPTTSPEGEATSADPVDAAWIRTLAGPGRVQPTGVDGSWSSVLQARHRDGHSVPVAMEVIPMAGPGGRRQWMLTTSGLSVAPATPDAGASMLRTLVERSPIPVAIWDTDLRCIWVNAAGSKLTGARSEDIGKPLEEAPSMGFDQITLGSAMRRVLDTGRPMIDLELRRTLPSGEESGALSLSVFRLEGADGTPQGLCTIGIDVSNSLARQRLALLNTAGTRVGTTLDVMTTAQELADVSLPMLADFVIVDLADWVPLGEVPRERPGSAAYGEPTCRRAGMASIHKGVPEAIFSPGEVVFYTPSSPMVGALTTGRSHFEPYLDTAHYWLREDTARARTITAAGMHSGMFVPLKARGAILGVAIFMRTDNPLPFTRDDLLLAEDLATRAALSLDNARRYARERNAALALQRDLLPRKVSGCCGLDITSRYLPTDKHEGVGGDWYDTIPLSGERIALVVGDVVGHGINAAAAMGRLRTAVHTLAALDLPPHRLLTHLDAVALRLSEETDDRDRFGMPRLAATCVYAVYDPATEVCTMSLAGHPPPAVVAPDGRATYVKAPAGGPVGWGIAAYESMDLRLTPGSTIALFTDGLIETRRDDIDTGLARLARALAHQPASLDDYCEHVIRTMLRTATPEDDISLLLARTWPCTAGAGSGR